MIRLACLSTKREHASQSLVIKIRKEGNCQFILPIFNYALKAIIISDNKPLGVSLSIKYGIAL